MSAWKPSDAGAVGEFEQLDHAFPAMHAAPADFAFGGKAFAMIGGNIGGEAKRLGDALLITFGILEPIAGAARRIDADDAVGPNAEFAQPFGDLAAFADLGEKIAALGFVAHRRPAAGAAPRRERRRSR